MKVAQDDLKVSVWRRKSDDNSQDTNFVWEDFVGMNDYDY